MVQCTDAAYLTCLDCTRRYIAHGNTDSPINLVANTKFIQRFLCGSRRYWHQHGVCEYLLVTLYGMCESLRNGDLPMFNEDFVPVGKHDKWLSDVEPYDADVLLTEDLTAVPGTFILAPKIELSKRPVGLGASLYDAGDGGGAGDDAEGAEAGGGGGGGSDAASVWAAAGRNTSDRSGAGSGNKYRLSFRGGKSETKAYHLSVCLVLNADYQKRPGATSQLDLSVNIPPASPPVSPAVPVDRMSSAGDVVSLDSGADANDDGTSVVAAAVSTTEQGDGAAAAAAAAAPTAHIDGACKISKAVDHSDIDGLGVPEAETVLNHNHGTTTTATTSEGAAIRVAFEAVGNAVQSEAPVGCPLNGLVAEAIVNEDAARIEDEQQQQQQQHQPRSPATITHPIAKEGSAESTRRMYSYMLAQDEHDTHGEAFGEELAAAGYLSAHFGTLKDVVEFCRLKPLRLGGPHGGVVFPTRQKFFRSDHDNSNAAAASLDLPFPLGDDRSGHQMGKLNGRVRSWRVAPSASIDSSSSVPFGQRTGSNASTQSIPVEHNFSDDVIDGSGAGGGGGGGGANNSTGPSTTATSGKLIVWTLSTPPSVRPKNPLEDLGLGICWDLHDARVGPFVCWVAPGSPAEARGLCPGFFLSSVQCGADRLYEDRATMRDGLLEAIRDAQPIHVDADAGGAGTGSIMVESTLRIVLSFTETSGKPLPNGGRSAPTVPPRFSVCKDWHVTQTLLEAGRGGEDLASIHETAALNTVQHEHVKLASGATQAHDDRHTEPHAYACYFGHDDVAESTVPVYLCFAGGISHQNALKQPLLLSECQWLAGKVTVSMDRLAKRVPLEPLINLLNKSHNGKPIRLVFTGHSIGGGVAQLVALRLLAYIDNLDEMETRSRVLEAETLLSNAATPAEHAAATAMVKEALDVRHKRARIDRNLVLMSNIHAAIYGSPMVCDHVFGKAAQKLLDKGNATFAFFSAHGDLIPCMLAALSVYETGIHDQAATNNSSRRKQYRSLVDGMARLIARVDAYAEISSLREIASKLKLTRSTSTAAAGLDDPGPAVVNGVITILSRCVERGVAVDFGIFGNWFRYDERKRPHAIDQLEQLRGVLQFILSPTELQAKDTEIMVRNHAFVNFRHHFSPTQDGGGGHVCVTHPNVEAEGARKLTAGCFGDALCHQSRISPGPLWARYWGKPVLAAAASPECSVVTRTSSHALSQMLTLVVTGEYLSFVTKVRVTLEGQQQEGADCTPDFSSTDASLRVTAELKTPVDMGLHGAKLVVKLQSHFIRKTWSTHIITLPEELTEAGWLSPRESRVASLDLGQLLNEAIVCASFGASIPDQRQLTETLAELELGKNETEDSRWTKQAQSHYKDTVDRVTDKETGNMLPGVEGLLTFSVTSQQVQKLGTIVVGKKGEDLKSFVHGFQETQEHDGDLAARQRCADIIGDDVEANARFQRDLSDAALSGADGVSTVRHVPALKFKEAIARHNLPAFDGAAQWSVDSFISTQHSTRRSAGDAVGASTAPAEARAADGGVPPGILTPHDMKTLEKESAGRRDIFVFRDKVATPFGHHFNPGKVCRVNVLSGVVEIDFTLSAAQAGIRGRRFARPVRYRKQPLLPANTLEDAGGRWIRILAHFCFVFLLTCDTFLMTSSHPKARVFDLKRESTGNRHIERQGQVYGRVENPP